MNTKLLPQQMNYNSNNTAVQFHSNIAPYIFSIWNNRLPYKDYRVRINSATTDKLTFLLKNLYNDNDND